MEYGCVKGKGERAEGERVEGERVEGERVEGERAPFSGSYFLCEVRHQGISREKRVRWHGGGVKQAWDDDMGREG